MASLPNKTDVLVVGAGPVGLLAALELARSGVAVEVIDKAWRSTAQSYACALHTSTLERLGALGLDRELLDAGKPIDSLAFYEGPARRAELHFRNSGSCARGLLVVPQDRLEEILENAVREQGVKIRWGHRLDDLHQEDHAVKACVEKLTITSVGYPYARSEEMVERETEVLAKFVIGADGSSSHVRQILGIPNKPVAHGSAYEFFEFEPAQTAAVGNEVRVAMGPNTLDAFWPQAGSTCRWSLEVPGDNEEEHPAKERSAFVVLNETTDAGKRDRLEKRIQSHAPWFDAGIKEIDWHTTVSFEPSVVERFGIDRCWLAGDAAHQTSPVGMQSMNVGLREAGDLAQRLARILKENASLDLLAEYQKQRLAEWSMLLGQSGGLVATPMASKWVANNRRRILTCLPGSGPELLALAAQLGLAPGHD
jgi:2-polyprenyl-6-methoxyphenol hydroxylase-like FAD-dependent oxidoreductase